MKKPWASFEKNYVAVETVDPRTGKPKLQYEYCGPWFLCSARPEIWRKAKLVSAGSLAADVAAVFWSGLMDSALNRAAATCVPFGLSVAALLFVVLGTGMFLASGMKMKRPDYERMDRLLRSAPVIEAILLFLASVLGIIYAFIKQLPGKEWVPAAGFLLGGFGSLLIFLSYRSLRYREEKNTEFEYSTEHPLFESQNSEN